MYVGVCAWRHGRIGVWVYGYMTVYTCMCACRHGVSPHPRRRACVRVCPVVAVCVCMEMSVRVYVCMSICMYLCMCLHGGMCV